MINPDQTLSEQAEQLALRASDAQHSIRVLRGHADMNLYGWIQDDIVNSLDGISTYLENLIVNPLFDLRDQLGEAK